MTDQTALPRHVGIIMDGNGRWAKKRGLPRNIGHKQGATAFGNIVTHASKLGIAHLTVYAFSTENWKRPAEEVAGIMSLLRSYLKDVERHKKNNIRVKILGDTTPMDDDIQRSIVSLEEQSAVNTGMVLNIALGYGGQDELVRAARSIAAEVQSGVLGLEDINTETMARHLYTAGQPEVDLIIRTSGEQRISNFLLWQSAYAEYVFTDVLWPDFTPRHFEKALREFESRRRTMGGV